MAHISIRDTVVFSFSFFFWNAPRIAARIVLPALGGWITSYVALYFYLTELEKYLGSPSDRIASLVLGLATAGMLVTLLMHSIIVSSIASLALGLEESGWEVFRIGRREVRLYAANLRFILICAGFIVVMRMTEFGMARFAPSAGAVWIVDIVMGGGLCWLAVRLGFLIPPIAVAKREGEILRRGWRLSLGHFWSMAAIAVVLALPGFAVELAGEFVMQLCGISLQFDRYSSLASLVAAYRGILPNVLVAVGIGYVVAIILLTAARVSVYRQLVDQAGPSAS